MSWRFNSLVLGVKLQKHREFQEERLPMLELLDCNRRCSLSSAMAKIPESFDTGVSSYLKNPTPCFNVTPFPEGAGEESEKQAELGHVYDKEEVMAAVAELLVFGFHGPSLNSHAKSLLSKGAGGVILFDRNIEDPEQVARLCANLKREAGGRPLVIMVDQEGGYVQRLGPPFTVIPHAQTVGNTYDVQAGAAIASVIGKELRAVNIDMNLAPVLDVDTNPQNTVIGKRSYGKTPSHASEFGFAYIRSIQREGVAACGKHYPGHGDTAQDSHVDLPRLSHDLKRLEEVEFAPFAKAIEADVAALMVGHIDVPCFSGASETAVRPATMCKEAIDYLRNVLMFEGVVITDCLEMGAIVRNYNLEEAAVEAVLAGVDMLLVSHTKSRQDAVLNALVKGVQTGRIPYNRVKDAVSRIANLKQTYVRPLLPHGNFEDSFWESRIHQVGCKEHHDIVANIVHQSAAMKVGQEVVTRNG